MPSYIMTGFVIPILSILSLYMCMIVRDWAGHLVKGFSPANILFNIDC